MFGPGGAMLALVLLALVTLVLVATGLALNRPGDAPVPENYLHGVDVARYQGRIDWDELADDGISFAFIKASEGGDYVDPLFHDNWADAHRAGVLRGAYHFFTLCRDGVEQAEHFLATVGGMSGAFVPALDAEHMGPCEDGPTMSDVTGGVLAFLDTVHAETGVRPVIYTNRVFYEKWLEWQTPGERYWLRSINTPPAFGPEDWLFWQYSARGRRRGIRGAVDLNVFAGDEAALGALTVP